jgi:lipopolysaccharide heptosyltransferase I
MVPSGESLNHASSIRRILIARLSSMGDVIHALPGVAALRETLPQAEIGWVIEERWAELLCAPGEPWSGPLAPERPLVDRIHSVDTRAWRHSWLSKRTWSAVAAVRQELRTAKYDVAIDFQGSIRSAVIARWAKAPIYGFAEPREKPAALLYGTKVASAGGHVIEQNRSLAEAITGSASRNSSFPLPRDLRAEQKMEEWLQKQSVNRFALINPGAGWGAKLWPEDRYAEVAKGLAEEGLRPILNAGPGEEQLVHRIEQQSQGTAVIVNCSITELIALTRRASLFIGGDTGPMHLAAALQVPVVAIFGPTDPARNGPFGTASKVLRSALSTTSYSHRRERDAGLLEIQVDEVLAAARDLLRRTV